MPLDLSCSRNRAWSPPTSSSLAEGSPLPPPQDGGADFPTLAAGHTRAVGLRELFLPILGNWTGFEEQAASPGAQATSARAMIVFKLDVSDRVVVQDYRQVRADGEEFSGHGVLMIDSADVMSPATPTPILWWFFDSSGYPPQPAHGGWQDGELIMHKATARGMAEHRFAIADDQLTYRIRRQLNDLGELDDFLSGTYRRISGH